MVREEESAIGSGRNEASVKAFATQSDGCASPPNTHTLKIGCRSQNPGAGFVDYRDSPTGARIMSSRLVSVLQRYLREAPLDGLTSSTLLGQEWRFRLHPSTWPLLAAFSTITAMFKCFKSMKIDIIRR